MIFKKSYIVAGSNRSLRRNPVLGPRHIAVFATATLASVMLGVAAFTLLTNVRPSENRVSWALQPPKIVKTISRSVAPEKFEATSKTERRS